MTDTAKKATSSASKKAGSAGDSMDPMARLKSGVSSLGQSLAQKGISGASDKMESWTSSLTDIAQGTTKGKVATNVVKGDSPVKAAVKGVASSAKDKVSDAFSKITGGGGKKGGKLKVTNILESVDVPVPVEVAYAQWTQFEDFPGFMKKVENVSQEEDEKVKWQAQIFWSHRTWTATIIDQVPNDRIVWKSEGEKGHVDGAVTFHSLAPNMTRILLVLEYHPKGLFEHTGNIWRAQGRRARLEFKHFARHVSTQTILHQDEIEAWPGEIHDEHVTSEDALSEREDNEQDESSQDEGKKGSDRKGRSQKDSDQQDDSDDSDSDDTDSDDSDSDDTSDDDTSDDDDSDEKGSSTKRAARKRAAKKSSAKKATAKKATAKRGSKASGGSSSRRASKSSRSGG